MEDKEEIKDVQGIKWYHPAFLIATWFGIGKIPFAPGTWGSLFAFPLFIVSHYLLLVADSKQGFINLYLLFITLLFVIGNWATNVYMKRTGRHDPKEVVIDEVVGQIIVFFAAFLPIASGMGVFKAIYEDGVNILNGITVDGSGEVVGFNELLLAYSVVGIPAYLVGFGLFRLFDIWKPWPIRYCDQNMKSGFGVMFDDLFAAVYAVIAFYGVIMLLGYFN